MNAVRIWLDREEENQVIFLLFSCYTRTIREWFALLFALLVISILAHTCWVRLFSCLSWEIAIHYTIVLIPTVFLLYVLVSNLSCDDRLSSYNTWEVRVYFARSFMVIHKYNRTLSTWLRTCHIFILLLSRKNQAQMKNLHDSSLPQQELAWIFFLHLSTFGSRFDTVCIGHYVAFKIQCISCTRIRAGLHEGND